MSIEARIKSAIQTFHIALPHNKHKKGGNEIQNENLTTARAVFARCMAASRRARAASSSVFSFASFSFNTAHCAMSVGVASRLNVGVSEAFALSLIFPNGSSLHVRRALKQRLLKCDVVSILKYQICVLYFVLYFRLMYFFLLFVSFCVGEDEHDSIVLSVANRRAFA
jgi:hypothetical protein